MMQSLKRAFGEIKKYPSAVLGSMIIFILILISISTVISIPYSEAIRLWRGGEGVWAENPRLAMPSWVNLFRREKLPETIIFRTSEHPEIKRVEELGRGVHYIEISHTFDFDYDAFPHELTIFLNATYENLQPNLSFVWRTPDGREIRLTEMSIRRSETYRISQDSGLERRLGRVAPEVGLFMDPDKEGRVPLNGTYELVVE